MKKVIELMRLNEVRKIVKDWIRKCRGRDDDMFDNPYAIF